MSWAAVDHGCRTDCLLECLREVRLEQFAGNFATRGITDCTKLAALERQQFATYGVTSPADIRRLTRLITVIRDLRTDGLLCRHGAELKLASAAEKPDSSRGTLSAANDLCQTSTSVQRYQKKQFANRRPPNNASTLRDASETRPKTPVSYRRPSRDAQQRDRGVKRAAPTATGRQLLHDSFGVGTQYDGLTSFTPLCQRTVSHLPTHVEKVRRTPSITILLKR